MSIEGSPTFNVGNREGPRFAFIDADNMKCQFESALVRRGVKREQLDCFDLNKIFWFSQADRYYVFSAVEDSSEPADWLKVLRATDSCIFRAGRLTNKNGRRKQQGVDVMLAVEALRCAFQGSLETCIIFGGDGDMLPLIEIIVSTAKRMIVAGFGDPNKGTVAPQLRDAADSYIHLGTHMLKSCLKDSHKFSGMQWMTAESLKADGVELNIAVDPNAKKTVLFPSGGVALVRDGPRNTGNVYTATFGSLLGAQAYIILNGPLNW